MLYIKNGRIITPDGVVEGYALALSQKIEGIINVSDIPEGAETIDACGNYVAPGLVDIHIHGYLGEKPKLSAHSTPQGKSKKKAGYGTARKFSAYMQKVRLSIRIKRALRQRNIYLIRTPHLFLKTLTLYG